MAFGEIEGYPPGSLFEDRRELAVSGVHRPLQAGICGRESEGAESIVLSGGYEDDTDWGDIILYTGQGGQDQPRGAQVHDQQLTRGNLALAASMRSGLPVRVIRGAHPDVYDPPSSGYRYDGLYRVEGYWAEQGRSGYRVWRFRLVPFEVEGRYRIGEQQHRWNAASRRKGRVQRIVRSTAIADGIKRLHGYRCQFCSERLETASGFYAEAAHIRPLGLPHSGPDEAGNVLCLCPNHHVLFDHFRIAIADDFALIGFPGRLRTHPRHRIDLRHLTYHRELFFAASGDR